MKCGSEMKEKPLGRKNYGHIPHLPGSRMGSSDHTCHPGQARIATEKARDKHDRIIVTEKLDGSNVGVARIGDAIYPLGRAGYLASSSPYLQHRLFANWAYENAARFLAVLDDGERLVGEWMAQAHGTMYRLEHEPFVAFDLMRGSERVFYDEFRARVRACDFVVPCFLHGGPAISVEKIMDLLHPLGCTGTYGFHGALEPVEGAVWRVERNKLVDRHSGRRRMVVDFLVKYVRSDKQDGKYLDKEVWLWRPE